MKLHSTAGNGLDADKRMHDRGQCAEVDQVGRESVGSQQHLGFLTLMHRDDGAVAPPDRRVVREDGRVPPPFDPVAGVQRESVVAMVRDLVNDSAVVHPPIARVFNRPRLRTRAHVNNRGFARVGEVRVGEITPGEDSKDIAAIVARAPSWVRG